MLIASPESRPVAILAVQLGTCLCAMNMMAQIAQVIVARNGTSIGATSGPWHISSKTKYPDLGAEWLNYVITSTQAKKLMFGQQQLPADSSAKAPANNPYLTAVYKAFKTVADDNGLLLYTDWASPSMYTTLQNEYEKLLAGRTTPQGMAKAVQSDWAKFDKTLH